MTPTLGGNIDPNFFARYDATVQAALNSGPNVFVIVDLVCIVDVKTPFGAHHSYSTTTLDGMDK